MAAGDEAQSIEIFEELCDICRQQGLLKDAPAGLLQIAQQQLADLAELMRSYGFPTPGWGEEEDAEESNGAADMAVDQVALLTCLSFMLFRCSVLCINSTQRQQNTIPVMQSRVTDPGHFAMQHCVGLNMHCEVCRKLPRTDDWYKQTTQALGMQHPALLDLFAAIAEHAAMHAFR